MGKSSATGVNKNLYKFQEVRRAQAIDFDDGMSRRQYIGFITVGTVIGLGLLFGLLYLGRKKKCPNFHSIRISLEKGVGFTQRETGASAINFNTMTEEVCIVDLDDEDDPCEVKIVDGFDDRTSVIINM